MVIERTAQRLGGGVTRLFGVLLGVLLGTKVLGRQHANASVFQGDNFTFSRLNRVDRLDAVDIGVLRRVAVTGVRL